MCLNNLAVHKTVIGKKTVTDQVAPRHYRKRISMLHWLPLVRHL